MAAASAKTVKEARPNFGHLLPPTLKDTVRAWLREDIPDFDYGGFVVGDSIEVAHLLGKSKGVLAGIPFFQAVFDLMECEVEWLMEEGDAITPICVVARVKGKVRNILMGERLALNIITRCSGIASAAREVKTIAEVNGWKGHVAATRKTTPGFRLVEKHGVLVGGCSTHRQNLSQMTMIKDNHVWSVGSISKAVAKAKLAVGFSSKIEVECQSLAEATEAIVAGADIVMLDNFEPKELQAAAKVLKEKYTHVIIEASGGITKDSIASYMCPWIDVLSMGALTQGYKALDFSLKIQRKKKAT